MKDLSKMTAEELSQLIGEASALLASNSIVSMPTVKSEPEPERTGQLDSTLMGESGDEFELVLSAKAFKGSEKCWLARLDYNEKHKMVRNRCFVDADLVDRKQQSARVWTERKVFKVQLNQGDWLEFCQAGSAKYDTREIVQYKDGKFIDQRGDEIETDFERI